MKNRTACLILYLLGFLTGFSFYYIKTLCTFGENIVYKDRVTGLTLSTEENLRFKVFSISKDNTTLMKFELNKINREFEKAAAYDQNQRAVGIFYLTDGKLNGIEMITENEIPFFQMTYDDEMNRWDHASYCKKTPANKFVGDYYEDINIDGQFDFMQAYDKLGNYIGNMVFFNYSWHPVIELGKDNLTAEIVLDFEKEDRLKLSFDFKKGWVPDSMKDSSVGDKSNSN